MKKQTFIFGAVAVVAAVLAYNWYKKNKTVVTVTPAVKATDANTSNVVGGRGTRMVVGGYDAANNRTWIFQEGNTGSGRFVPGRLNAPQGTIFTPLSA